jgi:hypothetical protein
MECIKCGVESYGIELLPILEDLIEKLLTFNNPKVFTSVLKVFGKFFNLLQETHPNVIWVIFEAISTIIFQLLIFDDENVQNCLEEFFAFANKFLLKFPLEVVQGPCIIEIIELAIHCCNINSKDSNALEFLKNLLTIKKNDLTCYQYQVMNMFGDKIINTLLSASIFIYPDFSKFGFIAEIFNSMKCASQQAFSELMKKSILLLPNRNIYGSLVSKCNLEEFFNTITR